MPISPREWKDELEPKDTELLAKIENKPYQAYSFSDLMPHAANDLLTSIANSFVLSAQLDRLTKKGFIKSKQIRGTTYYISIKAI